MGLSLKFKFINIWRQDQVIKIKHKASGEIISVKVGISGNNQNVQAVLKDDERNFKIDRERIDVDGNR